MPGGGAEDFFELLLGDEEQLLNDSGSGRYDRELIRRYERYAANAPRNLTEEEKNERFADELMEIRTRLRL